MSDLLPCPFCGGEARIFHFSSAVRDEVWRAVCDKPFCAQGPDGYTEAEAIAAWNTRAERTCKSTTDDNAWCFVCSECGKSFPRSQLHLAHNHGEINYCPNCGARVTKSDQYL